MAARDGVYGSFKASMAFTRVETLDTSREAREQLNINRDEFRFDIPEDPGPQGEMWAADLTIPAGSHIDIDLTALVTTGLANRSFAAVYLVGGFLKTTTPGAKITYGPGATNGWNGLGDGGDTEVRAGSPFLFGSLIDIIDVSPTSKIFRLSNPGASAVDLKIGIVGVQV